MKTFLALILMALGLQAANDQSVTIVWKPIPPPHSVGYYLVYYGNAPRYYHSCTNAGGTNGMVIYNLASGTNWHFAVTAVSSTGMESAYSDDIKVTIPTIIPAPVIVTNYWNVPPLKLELLITPR